MGRHKGDDVARFWSYVKTGMLDECWLWTGGKCGLKNHLYGTIMFNGRRQTAHRASYMINTGSIPDGMEVMHTCDNKLCVNPAHLEVGTHQQNIKDMYRRGRRVMFQGEENTAAKLTDAQVMEILEYLKQGLSHRAIAARYGVTSPTITCIAGGKTWKHVPR